MPTTRPVELPDDLLQHAVRGSRSSPHREVAIEALQEYLQPHDDERQRAAAIEDGLALLISGDPDHPDREHHPASRSPIPPTPRPCGHYP